MPPDIKDEDIIEIPSDLIALGHDEDGLPKTVAGDDAPAPKAKAEPKVDDQLEIARRRLEESQARISQMSADIEKEKTSRLKVENEALEDRTFAWRTHMSKLETEADALNGHISALTAAKAEARNAFKAAREAGDTDRESDANEKLAEATTALQTLQQLQRDKALEIQRNKQPYEQFEASVAQRKAAPEPKPEPKPLTTDDYIATAPKAIQGWLKDHDEFAKQGSKQAKKLDVFAADWLIDHDGDRASLDTEAFRRAADAKFFPDGSEEPTYVAEEEVEEAPKAAPKPKARVTAAAPVSRGDDVFSSRNLNAKAGKLPPKLASYVRASGLDATKYFHECVALIKKGDLPKNFLDSDYPHDY